MGLQRSGTKHVVADPTTGSTQLDAGQTHEGQKPIIFCI
ncbi:MAG: hypothetical protein ACI9PU_001122, partial [Ascidiaceihabitans sp.]